MLALVTVAVWSARPPVAQEEGAPPAEGAEERAAPPAETPPPSADLGAYAEADACAACHEEVANALGRTAHGRTAVKTWDGAAACQSCHGPGAAHVESGGEKDKIRNLRKLADADQSAVCLTCHERGDRSRWDGSPHDGRGLSCLTCHRIHQPADAAPVKALLVRETEFATCGNCHLKRKAALMRSAHMPMREGTMTCSSCHNPHGSVGPTLLKQDTVNENCYSCHAEKRSPVLWEHPPVRENCLNCHDPHGSLHPRMQIAKQPRMCQQCHDEARHPTQPYSDASSAPEFFPNTRMFDRGCMNCHSMIHGSNHPAGMRFLR
jgi:DmsE family decaheme c-type cytochrome